MQHNSLFGLEAKSDEHTGEYFKKFIAWMNEVGSFINISEKDINNHFEEKFEYSTNDTVTATNAAELNAIIEKAKTKFLKAFIRFPIENVEIQGRTAKASYEVSFEDRENHFIDDTNTVSVTFNKDGKVSSYSQTYSNNLAFKNTGPK